MRWNRSGLYRSRFGNYDLIANPGLVTLSRGLVAADVLASRLQGQDVRRSAFFAAVFDELGAPEPSPDGAVSAIDAATSFRSALITGATAAIAELPQMAFPVATRIASFDGRPASRPIA